MTKPSITLLALSLALLGVSRAEGPASSAPKEATVQAQQAATKRDFFKIRVTLEQAGKEQASCVAYCVEKEHSDFLVCTSSLAVDNAIWRVTVEADMRNHADDADVEITIDDLKAFAKIADGATVPLEIFSTRVQSKGSGSYLMGEVQGMTIKIEISAAEAALEQPAARPLSK